MFSFLQKWRITGIMLAMIPVFQLYAVPDDGSEYTRIRTIGNEAFAKGDYTSAASFYRQCQHWALERKDSKAIRDSSELLIDALISGKMPDEAEKILADYEIRFPGANPLSLSMWRADILLLKSKSLEAEKILERILPGLTTEDPRRSRVLLSLARACELNKKYIKASDVYRSLGNARIPENVKKMAYERSVLCLINSPTPELAWNELLSMPPAKDRKEMSRIKLLTYYAAVKTDGFRSNAAAWNSIREEIGKNPDEFSYVILSAIADTAASGGYFETAIEAYKGAYDSAPDKTAAFETVQRLIQVLYVSGDKKAAAAYALKVLDIFRGPYAGTALKFQFAGILQESGDFQNAVKIYLAVADDPTASRKTVEAAVSQAITVYVRAGDPQKAKEVISKYYAGRQLETEKAFQLCNLKFLMKDYSGAAADYRKLSMDFPAYREQGLYQAVTALAADKKYDSALKLMNELRSGKINPALYASSEYLRADILSKMGKSDEAAAAYQSYADMPGNNEKQATTALFEAGRIFSKTGEHKKAIATFNMLLKRYPHSSLVPTVLYWKIYLNRADGNFLLAERLTWSLADRYPDSEEAVSAMFNLAAYYAATESVNRAADVLENIQTRMMDNPLLRARILLLKIKIAYRNHNAQEAEALLKELLQNHPGTQEAAEGLYIQADQLRLAGDLVKATQYYELVLKNNPAPETAVAAIGSHSDCLFIQAGKNDSRQGFEAAVAGYRKVLEEKKLPDHIRAMTLYKLGRSLESVGSDDKALAAFQEVLCYLTPQAGAVLRLWSIKAAEEIISIAEKRPLRVHVEAAVKAVRKMNAAGILDHSQTEQRINKIHRLKHRL